MTTKSQAQANGTPKLEYIEWDDSSALNGRVWNATEHLISVAKQIRCRSIGWVVHETRELVIIAGHHDGNEDWSGDMTIPKSAIRKRRNVRVITKR